MQLNSIFEEIKISGSKGVGTGIFVLIPGDILPQGFCLKILSLKPVYGPSVYHNSPTLNMKIDLENWAETASDEIPGFTDNLLKMLPGLQKHTCSPGYEGGFVERLRRGTYMGHIIEHIALELSDQVGIGVSYGKTRYAGAPGVYQIVTRFLNEEGMKECLKLAVQVAETATKDSNFNFAPHFERMREIILDTSLGPSTKALVEAAEKRNIPWRRLSGHSLIQLGQGKHARRIQTAVTDDTCLIAADLAQDKELTKKILDANFLPVPKGESVSSLEELENLIKPFSPPYVVKPLDGNHGNGVSLNLQTREDVLAAYEQARKFSSSVLIEEMCEGRDYRILVVNGKLAAAAERSPPQVEGDGTKTIWQLIDNLNLDPRRGVGHASTLTRVEVDPIMLSRLKKQNLDLDSLIPAGEIVVLRDNANLSSGGTAADVTSDVHPEKRSICERAARVIGLDICGIDLICPDISKPFKDDSKIIEVNAGPGLRMHLAPSSGKAQPVAEAILEMLYPGEQNGRIPVLSVTGTNGKTSVTRMLHKILGHGDKVVGMTTTDGIWLGKEKIYTGDTTGPMSTQVVLSDPKSEAVVLEVARGGLLRGGLAYDWSDVSVITNIASDHIGQDGIESIDDIVWIKSLVAERVRIGGTLVLNADDSYSLALKDNPRVRRGHRNIFLYSIHADNPELLNHLSNDGSGAWIENGWVCLYHKGEAIRVLEVADMPCTLGGIAEFQVSNLLAAVSAAIASGISVKQISESLGELMPANENIGRANLYKIRDRYVMLDYGHNEPAFQAMGRLVDNVHGYHKIAIVGLPGDRENKLLEDSAGVIAEHFDEIIIREEKDLRGRLPGVVSNLMAKRIAATDRRVDVKRIPDEVVALRYAIEHSPKDSFIVLFYEDLAVVRDAILEYDPEPVRGIPAIATVGPNTTGAVQTTRGLAHVQNL